MAIDELDETGQQYLIQLFEQTKGDTAAQVSMYDVGEGLGMDHDTSARVAENLIGLQLAEIRTLSGGIGISAEGAAAVKGLMGGASSAGEAPGRLSDQPIMDAQSCRTVEQVADALKSQTGNLGLDFDGLSEMMSDLKSIDAQLGSSRPKTAIIRECLRSIAEVLDGVGNSDHLVKVKALLGE
ncbi:MAG: hypothetical protein JRF36_05805 [Deltaproteobacteria bacterium]|jgi:hypothetical protein|nr:hypothetical protein [Deltaproteobacteria bacterium]